MTTIGCTASDSAGHTGSNSFTVTVQDTTPPVFTTPIDQTFEATGVSTMPTLVAPTATDLVDPSPVITYSPHSFPVGANQTVTWTAKDASGNSVSTTSQITITDTTAPTVTLVGDAVVSVAVNGTYTDPGVTAVDFVDPSPVITASIDGGATTTVGGLTLNTSTEGGHTVLYCATDSSGNSACITRTVVVSDLTPFSAEQGINVTSNRVTINWTTPNPGTSRVLYDTVSHDPITDLSAPDYGYANSTDETDDTPTVTTHSVTISGLNPSTTYFFRPLSTGSPDTLGDELSATTSDPPAPQVSSGGGGGGGGGTVISGPLSIGYVNTDSSGGGSSGGLVLGTSTEATGSGTQSSGSTGSGSSGSSSSCYVFTKGLAMGSTGSDVTALQNLLTADGYYSGPITGYYGSMTTAAVKKFQAANGIEQVGIVGPKTRAALNACGTPPAPTTAPNTSSNGGSVLGASTYNFTLTLKLGSSGTEVNTAAAGAHRRRLPLNPRADQFLAT